MSIEFRFSNGSSPKTKRLEITQKIGGNHLFNFHLTLNESEMKKLVSTVLRNVSLEEYSRIEPTKVVAPICDDDIDRDKKINEIEAYNHKWLEYMANFEDKINRCPNGHILVAYVNRVQKDKIIITCPEPKCNYYDYNSFWVPRGTKLPMSVEK